MADFQQHPRLATLHGLGAPDRPRLESELVQFAATRPLALVLPLLPAELGEPALAAMLEDLAGAAYLGEIVFSLGRAGKKELTALKALTASLPQETLVINSESRRVKPLLSELAGRGWPAGQEGKGRAVWLALAVLAARGRTRVVALHDGDVADYDRLLLGRLVHPVLNPATGFVLAKGYYARYTHQLHGRLTRLLLWPALAALEDLLGPLPALAQLAAFRYPLAGECAWDLAALGEMRLRPGWGLELGLLAEARRLAGPGRLCQVDLADRHEHKHQELIPGELNKGLGRMALEVARTLLAELATEGAVFTPGSLLTLTSLYLRHARGLLPVYAAESALAGLLYPRPDEEATVETFARALARAGQLLMENHAAEETLPSPARLLAGETGRRLLEAVEADNLS
ncbi:MAG: glycosyl transferase [Deltaproteobacteria bacterium]|nr:glycosyl transferase [Deltaproteobacteria bacterium]MCB2186333.1 glycosyl transferase [Deltaproteobacteria bacterium]